MSLFGTYITNNKDSIKESTESSVTSTIQNKEIKESIKEDNVMDNYGIIVNENGQKELIELSEAEFNAVIEARQAIEETKNAYVSQAGDAKDSAATFIKAAANGTSKGTPKTTKQNIDAAKKAVGKAAKSIAGDVQIKFDTALNVLADKLHMNTGTLRKILFAAGAATAAGASVAAIVSAIKNHKKKNESANESVMIYDEDGNASVVEITNEEFEAIVECRIENGEDNVCRLTLTQEEVEAIAEVRKEEQAQ